MNYAIIETGVVTNVIILLPFSVSKFPNAVNIEGLSVQIGDTYVDGRFYHDGEPIYSLEEQLSQAQQIINIMAGEVE